MLAQVVRDLQDIKRRVGIPSVPESAIQQMREVFLKYDRDGSGVVDKEEFRLMAPEV